MPNRVVPFITGFVLGLIPLPIVVSVSGRLTTLIAMFILAMAFGLETAMEKPAASSRATFLAIVIVLSTLLIPIDVILEFGTGSAVNVRKVNQIHGSLLRTHYMIEIHLPGVKH